MPCYCELCGREVFDERQCRTVVVEGAVLRVCPQCYNRLVKQGKAVEYRVTVMPRQTIRTRTRKPRSIPKRILMEEYEVVPDYAKRIRQARERMGWSTRVLAEKVREKENVIKRIEAGRLTPSIELARRLERVLHIRLLEPVVDEYSGYSRGSGEEDYFTIGDLIKIKTSKK